MKLGAAARCTLVRCGFRGFQVVQAAAINPGGAADEGRRRGAADEFDLKEAVSCMFVFQPGNAAVAVSWQRATDASGAPTLVLHMKGYKTAFDSP